MARGRPRKYGSVVAGRHSQACPFPMKHGKLGLILNERCRCGHLRTEHFDSLVAFGHGECTKDDCNCGKFSWKEFINVPSENNQVCV